ncbi:ribosome recycling factor [Peniophora sp. CONT]|nr:ribosome recycling factor [Peniophora sp. CONT]
MSLLLARAARNPLLRASTSTSRVSALSLRQYAKKTHKNTKDARDIKDAKDVKDVEIPPRGKKNSIRTDALVSHSQQKIQDPSAAAEYDKADEKMTAAVAWLKRETAQGEARAAGRVTPALLDPVRVVLPDTEGYRVKIEEVATVGVRDGSVLVVTVFEPENLKSVEDALYEAQLPGVIPQRVDERTLRIPIPKPTVDARKAVAASAVKQAEETRQQLRKAHQAGVKKGKFERHSIEMEEFQKLLDKHIKEVDNILAAVKKSAGVK